jgi:uncharacterized membrane protein YfcA
VDAIFLCFFAFLAGFVDSVVGGGGLIQLPALLLFLPAESSRTLAPVFGTNKFAAICGTSMATVQYARRVQIQWRFIFPAAIAALIFSFLGARVVSYIRKETMEPVIVALMIAVAIYTFRKKDFGHLHAPKLTPAKARALGVIIGVIIGFYDGFFGPGTGSFLIFIFIGLFGFDFLNASAHAKVINFSTNLGAVALFAANHNILYRYALPMAACNIAGSITGTSLAILKGNRFVRTFFLLVVSFMIVRYGWKILEPYLKLGPA